MRELTLDIDKWRCGQNGKEGVTALNTQNGATFLLNSTGYMCCLGQFARQLGVEDEALRYEGCPSELNRKVPILTKPVVSLLTTFYDDTRFSMLAIRINDDRKTTIADKVKKLKALCSKFKIKLLIKGKIPTAA